MMGPQPMTSWHIVAQAAELGVEAARYQSRIGLTGDLSVDEAPVGAAQRRLEAGSHVALALGGALPPDDLARLAAMVRRTGQRVTLSMLGTEWEEIAALELAHDLGLVALSEVAPLISATALLAAGAKRPWRASLRTLPKVDRQRLHHVCSGARGAGSVVALDDGLLGFLPEHGTEPIPVGEPRDVAAAIAALRAADRIESAPATPVGEVNPDAVVDLLFGPARALSDPASKQALTHYGVPIPEEELCTSASRAAALAGRLGFPVRLALASPDLRIWDHPDLAQDGVDSAARVRDVYRQLWAIGEQREEDARLLGVTVSKSSPPIACLRVVLKPMAEGNVLTEIGFGDPHGAASGDRTHTVLPAPGATVERTLTRLAGSPLLLHGAPAHRRATVAAIRDLLLRVAALVNDTQPHVRSVEIDPVAVLTDGTVEAREACIAVSDAFERTLEAPA